MSSSLDLIRKYYRDSKPDEPITPDDPRWVDLSPLRGSGRDITDLILRRIQREDESETLLVTGFRGTGKTSLLKACQQQLEHAGYRVIFADAESDYIIRTFEKINLNDEPIL